MLQELDLNSILYSLHTLRRGGVSVAYRVEAEQIQIKQDGLWSSERFWDYVISMCVQRSPVASALAGSLAAT